MFNYRNFALGRVVRIAPRYLPFADVASDTVPLSRLLRLSLFQVTVGMALVLLVGTLNRVMIVELKVPASLVSVMLALPLVFAPFRALIGHKSDTYKSALGIRRLPFIFRGTMLQFGGFAVMPFALLVLSGYADAVDAPKWLGHGSAALAFLLVGAGLHTVQTVGLALATDLVPQEDHPKVVGLMYVMMLLGMIASALAYGWLLRDYTPGRLIQVIQGSAVVTIVLNAVALWKQEARDRARGMSDIEQPGFLDAWRTFSARHGAIGLLAVVGLGTAGFGMADVLLEPYGGQILGMTVGQTTRLTAVFASGGLIGFTLASIVLNRGFDPLRMAGYGALAGVPAFVAIALASDLRSVPLFVAATLLAGFGGGLFSHGTLTATMRSAPREQSGLALGAWGAVGATSAGVALAAGGLIRDLALELDGGGAVLPYTIVFGLEAALLLATLGLILPLGKKLFDTAYDNTTSPREMAGPLRSDIACDSPAPGI
jgi:BCD family chlorophyll transporter-like MFS transporter